MKEIIEITFENVELKALLLLLKQATLSSVLRDYQIQADNSEVEIDFKKSTEVLNVLNDISNGVVGLNFKTFLMKNFKLDDTSLQILKYNDELFDLNILCDYNLLFNKYSTEFLQHWAIDNSVILRAKSVYCGYEPSSDKNTRFFTGYILGPLNYESTKNAS